MAVAGSELSLPEHTACAQHVARSAVGVVFTGLTLTMPGIAVAALLLLALVYAVASAVLAGAALLRAARRTAPWQRLVRDEIANLDAGGAAQIWPAVTLILVVVVLGA
jgi:hypothetical protein